MKHISTLIAIIIAATLLAACSGGGGDEKSSAKGGGQFQSGLTPKDISGCFNITAAVTGNTCGEMGSAGKSSLLCLSQDNNQASATVSTGMPVVTVGEGGETVTGVVPVRSEVMTGGEVSDNSFRFNDIDTQTFESCTLTFTGLNIGTIEGDSIGGVSNFSVTASAGCGESASSCSVATTYTGSRATPDQARTTPNGFAAGSSIDTAAPVGGEPVASRQPWFFYVDLSELLQGD